MTAILPELSFDDRIATRSARVGIVGLGYAGLPLAMAFAEAGFDVTGVDLSHERVQAIADRVIVLRLGRRVAEMHKGQYQPDDLVSAITGSRETVIDHV